MNVLSRVTLIKQEKVRVSLVCTSKYVACKKYIYVYLFPQESPELRMETVQLDQHAKEMESRLEELRQRMNREKEERRGSE